MELIINAYFNKMTRDSKKELMQFHVKGEAEGNKDLHDLCREVVEIGVDGLEPLTAEYTKNNKDSKKTVLEFVVNPGASNNHSYEYFELAGDDVELTITKSKVTVEEFREGLKGKIHPDGTVEIDENQTTIEEYIEGDEDQEEDEGSGEVEHQDDEDEDELF